MKIATPPALSDRELFERLPFGDPWHDAQMVEVWRFLYTHAATTIPDSWQDTMSAFNELLLHNLGR